MSSSSCEEMRGEDEGKEWQEDGEEARETKTAWI